MQSLICKQPFVFEYSEVSAPYLVPGHAIMRIRRVGICGTDIHAYMGTQPYFSYPRILGHELSGEIVETEDGVGYRAGDPVTIIPYFNCGRCIACINGIY